MKRKIILNIMFLGLVLPNCMYAWKFTWRNLTSDTLKVKLEEKSGWFGIRCRGTVHKRTVGPGQDAVVKTRCCAIHSLVEGPTETRQFWLGETGSGCGGILRLEKGYDQLIEKNFYKLNGRPKRLR